MLDATWVARRDRKRSGKSDVKLLVEEARVMFEGLDSAGEAVEKSHQEPCNMATAAWNLCRRLHGPEAKGRKVREDVIAAAEESLQE